MSVPSRRSRKAGTAHARRSLGSMREVSKPARPTSIEDLYGGGYSVNLLKPQYEEMAFPLLQNRHTKGASRVHIDEDGVFHSSPDSKTGRIHDWKVPYGVREALRKPLRRPQLIVRYPFYVTWRSPTTHKRYKKVFASLPASVLFAATRAQYADRQACIISRQGYDIPAKLRNKLPKPWKWCPCCMMPRKFYRVLPEENFYALIRDPDTLIRKERKLKLLRCKVCGITNRNHIYRRSNQVWVVRKFKRGARRARRR